MTRAELPPRPHLETEWRVVFARERWGAARSSEPVTSREIAERLAHDLDELPATASGEVTSIVLESRLTGRWETQRVIRSPVLVEEARHPTHPVSSDGQTDAG